MSDSERELLSAAYDREATPAEKAQADEWLRASPEKRREWEEFQQLSALLQELPREELPAEFPSRVLALAEQRSLLPVASSSPTRQGRWLTSFLTASAVLILMGGVWWLATRSEELRVVAMQQPANQAGDRAESPRSVALPPSPAARSEGILETARPDPKADAMPPLPMAAKATAMAEDQAPESGVPVVRVFVVDEADGMKLVQQVLERHQVAYSDSGQKTEEKAATPDEALCVVASQEQIDKALREIRRSQSVTEVDESRTLLAYRKLPADVKQFFDEEAASEPAVAREDRPAPAPSPEAENMERESKKGVTRSAQGVSRDADGQALRSRQMKVLLPVPEESVDKEAGESAPGKKASRAKDAKDVQLGGGSAPVRLILLVRRSADSAKAAAPAAKPGEGS